MANIYLDLFSSDEQKIKIAVLALAIMLFWKVISIGGKEKTSKTDQRVQEEIPIKSIEEFLDGEGVIFLGQVDKKHFFISIEDYNKNKFKDKIFFIDGLPDNFNAEVDAAFLIVNDKGRKKLVNGVKFAYTTELTIV